MKLSKRVSDLEHKLASARKELQTVLHKDVPPVPPLPVILPPTPSPELSQDVPIFSQPEVSQDTQMTEPEPETSPVEPAEPTPSHKPVGKIVKKRKATVDDETYKPIPTDSDGDISMSAASEPERSIKRVKSTSSRKGKKQSSRLTKSRSSRSLRKEYAAVTVVPDGNKVPAVPAIPNGVEGKKSKVRDDGFGGFGHEIF